MVFEGLKKLKENFFIGLPKRKEKVRTGFCEPPEGDLHNSLVVNIDFECRPCVFLRCHMFETRLERGEIVNRIFINHQPEYGE